MSFRYIRDKLVFDDYYNVSVKKKRSIEKYATNLIILSVLRVTFEALVLVFSRRFLHFRVFIDKQIRGRV